jgi:hypothetical protein
VAAFFAFDEQGETDFVAVYAFVPSKSGGCYKDQEIVLVGPYGRSHPRHLLQQCWYTWCVKKNPTDYLIVPHNDVISEAAGQDGKVLKMIIPIAERLKVLKELNRMKINEYSLFGSEDSLVRTIARRDFMFKKN